MLTPIAASKPDKKCHMPTSKAMLNKAKVDYFQQSFAPELICHDCHNFTYFQKFTRPLGKHGQSSAA
jgi:hypothetical protein